MPANIGKTI
jgi:hypothetical protein